MLEAIDGHSLFFEKYGHLSKNYYRDHSVYMYAGNSYRLHGACSNYCKDIDMKIIDGYGNVISADNSYNDLPYTSVNVYSSGYFTIRVSMESCSSRSCRYGFAVFSN